MREDIGSASNDSFITVPDSHLAAIGHPEDILHHPGLAPEQKRSILASWASDVHAIEGAPALRQLESGAIVPVDDILGALRSLDDAEQKSALAHGSHRVVGFQRLQSKLLSRMRRAAHVRRRDDDDDPPPCPAVIAWPVRRSLVEAHAQGLRMSAA